MRSASSEPGPQEAEVLSRECRLFNRYLLRRQPDPETVSSYLECHRKRKEEFAPRSRMDRFLVSVARTGRPGLRIADSYCALVAPSSILRKKLVLMAAIAESRPASAGTFEEPDDSSLFRPSLRSVGALASSVLTLMAAVVLLGPVHLALRVPRGGESEGDDGNRATTGPPDTGEPWTG